MAEYKVIEKSGAVICAQSAVDIYRFELATLKNSSGNPAALSDIEIGDFIWYWNGAWCLKIAPFSPITEIADYFPYIDNMKWFKCIYPKIRYIPEGNRNNYIALAMKIVEYSYIYKDNSLLKKISPKLSGYSKELLDYIVANINNFSFHQIIDELNEILSGVELFGRSIFETFNNDLNLISRHLQVSFKLISFPQLTCQIVNPSKPVEFFFLLNSHNWSLLYNHQELHLIEVNSESAFIKDLNRIDKDNRQIPEKLSREIGLANKSLDSMNKLLYTGVRGFIERKQVSVKTLEILDYLDSVKWDTATIRNAIKKTTCLVCHSIQHVVFMDCGHQLCLTCYTASISAQTNGCFVYNKPEKLINNLPQCPVCSYLISDTNLETNLPNYSKYVRYAEARLKFTCAICNRTGNLDLFSTDCYHVCNECFFDALRRGFNCPVCKRGFSFNQIDSFFSHQTKCDACNSVFNSIKGFVRKRCEHSLCISCSNLSNEDGKCLVDLQPFAEQGKLIETERKCINCQVRYNYLESHNIKMICNCSICEACQVVNGVDRCLLCGLEFGKDLNQYFSKKYKKCEVCYIHFKPQGGFTIEKCMHSFCSSCFEAHINIMVSENSIDQLLKCPSCFIEIPGAQMSSLFKADTHQRIVSFNLERDKQSLWCYACNSYFTALNEHRKQICSNSQCNKLICRDCKWVYHEEEYDCKEEQIQEKLNNLKSVEEDSKIAQCPRCRLPYSKNEGCFHVKCINLLCGVEFCFNCSCLRQPTVAHGSHYHRPSCNFYRNNHSEADVFLKECSECLRLGSLCPRPKNLNIERRVGPNETS